MLTCIGGYDHLRVRTQVSKALYQSKNFFRKKLFILIQEHHNPSNHEHDHQKVARVRVSNVNANNLNHKLN